MEKLREAIRAKHKEKVSSYYTQLMLSGKIQKKDYVEILYNHLATYSALEMAADALNLFDGIEGLKRKDSIWCELERIGIKGTPYIAPATKQYAVYVSRLRDPKAILAHMYIRHLNLVEGGHQMLKVIPFAGEFYQFENATELRDKFLLMLDDSMIPEAEKAFDMIAQMFDQLEEHKNGK